MKRAMPNELPDTPERIPDIAPPAAVFESQASESDQAPSRRRQKAWLGMGAVLVALVLLTLLPGPGTFDSRRATAVSRWRRRCGAG